MARSRNPAETVAALLEVLGLRTAEVITIKMLITSGSRAWRHVNVSSKLTVYYSCILVPTKATAMTVKSLLSLYVLTNATSKHRQTRRLSASPHAPDAAPSRNLVKTVVAVAAVLGSKTVEVLVTQNFSTHGMRVSRLAKHDHNPRQ